MHDNVTCLFLTFRFKTNEIFTIMSHYRLLVGRVFLVFAFKTNEISILFLKEKPQNPKKPKNPKKQKVAEPDSDLRGGALDMTP